VADPDIGAPKTIDLQWLDGRLRLMFEEASIEVFASHWKLNGSVRVRVTHDGAYKDLSAPLGMIANRDWDALLKHWREEQHSRPWVTAPLKIHEPGVVRRVSPPLRKGQVIH
jgi:hypothetical protein